MSLRRRYKTADRTRRRHARSNEADAKRDSCYLIPKLTGMWNRAEQWLKTYKKRGVSKNGADRLQKVAGEDESDPESGIEILRVAG